MSIPEIYLNSPLKPLKTPPAPQPLLSMADRANTAVEGLFTPYDELETWSKVTFLPCPYDDFPVQQFNFSAKGEEVDLRNKKHSDLNLTGPGITEECVTLFLYSPRKNAAADTEAQPRTPQQPKRKRAFTENSPSTPLLSPEAREKFGKIASPLWTHNASNFNKMHRNSKDKMKFKQELKKLAKKPVHTFEVGSPTKSADIQTTPDKEGRLKHKGRYLRLHEPAVDATNPTVKKPNRIIPAIGPFLIRQPGAMSSKMATDYQDSPVEETFNEFLTRECPRLFKTLHPTSPQMLETTGLDFVEAQDAP